MNLLMELEHRRWMMYMIADRYPKILDRFGNDHIAKVFNQFFNQKIQPIFVPMTCTVKNMRDGFTIDISSGCFASVFDKVSTTFTDNRYECRSDPIPYAKIVPALKRLEELRLIADLSISESVDATPVSISFIYANPALQTCLATAGNILELYIWREAKQTRVFDNVQPNFYFVWKEKVDNELDVIMTKGLCSLIVSAKTARFERAHLYEIKYLAEHFSLNSKPVIVYASNKTAAFNQNGDDMLAGKKRARAMGVYLIDLSEPNMNLGERLAAIAAGDVMP